MAKLSGHCLCGAVAFELAAPPLTVIHCHCESCRRATSSPMTTFVIARRTDVRFTKGSPKAYASSPGVKRSFCPECGSPLAYESEGRPDQIDLYAASLSNPALVTPVGHVHAQEQLPWLEVLDDLPRYATTSRDGGPMRKGPRPAP
jgi:hypothetical protein